MKHRVFHVIPAGEDWIVMRKGARRPAAWCAMKRTAIDLAKAFVRKSRRPGQVVVHGREGKIQTEWTYESDPRRTPG